jgi:outer membrane protein OmpA-like peptidoglycan-associated protein
VIPVDKWIRSRRPADSGWTHYNDIEFLLGVSYLLGRRTAESDGDGVPDDLDGCPDTPRGARVDGKGCPIDSDQDAVPDGIDQCPATPKGASVDERGCPRDTDQDGVEDGLDRCPDSPEGCMVDDRGCPEDSDHDYICNGLDRCPNTPQGCVVDGRGCPLDGDHDGVCDGVDKCPETTAGDRVDAAGCAMLQKEAHILKGITFAYNSARIESLSYPVLNEAAATLKNNPSVRVEIGGHTDSTGSASGNVGLSKMRAEAVKRHLVSKGVPVDQMVTKGYGAAQPIASNETRGGRAENRRIEFKVLLR